MDLNAKFVDHSQMSQLLPDDQLATLGKNQLNWVTQNLKSILQQSVQEGRFLEAENARRQLNLIQELEIQRSGKLHEKQHSFQIEELERSLREESELLEQHWRQVFSEFEIENQKKE